jgi:hypothetical protein
MSMIRSHKFNWVPRRSAWQNLQERRARRSEAIQKRLDLMNSLGTSVSNALQNNITTAASNAGHAALKRVQQSAKDVSAKIQSQIDAAQSLIDQTSAPTSSSSSGSNSSWIDTIA